MNGESQRGEMMRKARYSAILACCVAAGPACAESGGFFKDMFSGGGRDSPSIMAPKALDPNEAYCPHVTIADGTAVVQSYAGAAGDRNRLRHQIVFGELSRECTANPDGSLTVKVGVILRALLGPAGAPGRFETPLTFAIKYNDRTINAHTRRLAVTIPSGAAQGTTSVVEDGLTVPADKVQAYEIEVALAGPAGRAKAPARTASKRGAKPSDDGGAVAGSDAEAAGQ